MVDIEKLGIIAKGFNTSLSGQWSSRNVHKDRENLNSVSRTLNLKTKEYTFVFKHTGTSYKYIIRWS